MRDSVAAGELDNYMYYYISSVWHDRELAGNMHLSTFKILDFYITFPYPSLDLKESNSVVDFPEEQNHANPFTQKITTIFNKSIEI